jgi:hypothetical protein
MSIKYREHLNDGPSVVPAWNSCDGCRHFGTRAGMAGGDCYHPAMESKSIGSGQRCVQRDHNERAVSPKWCPALQGKSA